MLKKWGRGKSVNKRGYIYSVRFTCILWNPTSQLDGGTRPVLYKPNIQIVVYLCLATLLHYTCPSGRAGTIEVLVYKTCLPIYRQITWQALWPRSSVTPNGTLIFPFFYPPLRNKCLVTRLVIPSSIVHCLSSARRDQRTLTVIV